MERQVNSSLLPSTSSSDCSLTGSIHIFKKEKKHINNTAAATKLRLSSFSLLDSRHKSLPSTFSSSAQVLLFKCFLFIIALFLFSFFSFRLVVAFLLLPALHLSRFSHLQGINWLFFVFSFFFYSNFSFSTRQQWRPLLPLRRTSRVPSVSTQPRSLS